MSISADVVRITPPTLTSTSLIKAGQIIDRGLEILRNADASIVHDHVELREIALQSRHKGSDLRRICDIALHRVEHRMLRFHRIEPRLAATGNDHFVAQLEEFERERQANARGAASDEDSVTGES